MKEEIRELAKNNGFCLFGVADPVIFKDYPRVIGKIVDKTQEYLHPLEIAESCKSVLVFAIEAKSDIFDTVIKSEGEYSYRAQFYYETIEHRLNKIKQFIENAGYNTFPLKKFSFKRAAILAGLGYPGKNTLVTTLKYGSNLRFGVILTDLFLKPDEPNDPFSSELCGKCNRCINICPVNAIEDNRLDFNKCLVPALDVEKKGSDRWNKAYELQKHFSNESYIECNKCQKICRYNS